MIRLKRVGRKNDPSYRVVLIESHKGPKSGKINEVLGFYDPRRDVKEIKGERVKEWMSKGAQVSDTVHNILVSEKIIEGKKINVLPRKSPIIKDSESKEDPKGPGDSESKEESKDEAPAEAEAPAEKEAPKEEVSEKETPSDPPADEPAPPADEPSDSKDDSEVSVKEETK